MATTTARKKTAKKPAARTTTKTTTTAKKPAAKRKYGPAAAKSVRKTMDEMQAGKLRSGGSGKQVTNPKQAIAIGLAEARRSGAKVPPDPNA